MLSCKIDFNAGTVFLGGTVLDQWTDEVFLKRVFPEFEHTHDFSGAAVYAGDIAMTIDDCHFNRIMIHCHKKRLNLPPVIQEIYFFLDKRPDWADNKLFRMTQAHTDGPAVRPGSTYRVTTPIVDILASDAFGGRQAHLRFRYNNANYSYNRTLTPAQLEYASMRAGVIRLNGKTITPGTFLGVKMLMNMTRQKHWLASDFSQDALEGSAEINTDNNNKIREILFRCHQFERGSYSGNAKWLKLHFGSTDDDLIVHTSNGRVVFSPRAIGIKITFHPEV